MAKKKPSHGQHALTLSKTQFLKGKKSPYALWYYKHHFNDVASKTSKKSPKDLGFETRMMLGNEVGELAKTYYPNGAEVLYKGFDILGDVQETEDFIAQGYDTIYEATAVNPHDGTYAKIDMLKKVRGKDEWDLIEVKSSGSVKDYHVEDMAFQYHVFKAAGYKIRNCILMHPEKNYVRDGNIDPKSFFRKNVLTKRVLNKISEVESDIEALIDITKSNKTPPEDAKLPSQTKSIKKTFKKSTGNSFYENTKRIEQESVNSGNPHVDKESTRDFLDKIEYPVYYLDYETISSPIPMFDGTKPFQQVPFQFSLHIQDKPNGPVKHHSFLHTDNTSDPRKDFADTLVKLCKKKGSVIVYNKSFEASRNNELAAAFPHHADALQNINDRMIDLYPPFQKRHLYHPDQQGKASLKAVLAAFTPHTYENLDIAKGDVAANEYLHFFKGKKDTKDLPKLFDDLEKYCALDTFAMVALIEKMGELCKDTKPAATKPPKNKPKP